MKKLSEILNRIDELTKEYQRIDTEMNEGKEKDEALEMISLAIDCLDTNLMHGDYINDTGKNYNYWED